MLIGNAAPLTVRSPGILPDSDICAPRLASSNQELETGEDINIYIWFVCLCLILFHAQAASQPAFFQSCPELSNGIALVLYWEAFFGKFNPVFTKLLTLK